MDTHEKISLMEDFLPDTILGWSTNKTTPLLSHSDLYGYMDGGAELYISYGFRAALSRTYLKESQPEILVEVYDLIESRNAFGVFSQSRESENVNLGQGAFSLPGAIFFWKDHYYISLSSWESTQESMQCLHALGDYIDKKITSKGIIPDVVKLLPQQGLVPFGYMYFHHYIWLNSYYFISHDNLLLIDDNTHALVARYDVQGNRHYLLLIQYDNGQTAAKAFVTFQKAFFPEGLTDHCTIRDDNTWMATAVTDRHIAAVFHGNTQQSVSDLLSRVLHSCQTISLK